MNEFIIQKAEQDDLPEILQLQYLAYESEAELFGTRDIPPLKQTLEELIEEHNSGIVLMVKDNGVIIGSVRAITNNDTVYIGKLMVHPEYRCRGLGKQLLLEVERLFPGKRYELFTSTKSKNNIRLYNNLGYIEFAKKVINKELEFVYLEKITIYKK